MSYEKAAKSLASARKRVRLTGENLALGALGLAGAALLRLMAHAPDQEARLTRNTQRNEAPPKPPVSQRQATNRAVIEELKRIQQDQVREVVGCYRSLEKDALRHFGLTKQEKAVAEHILSEASQQEIAELMYLSINTIKSHLRNIHAKAGVSSSRDLRILVRKKLDSTLE